MRLRLWIALLAGLLAFSSAQADRLRVLCLASKDLAAQGLDNIQPEALAAYRQQGIELDFAFYQEADAALLKRYAVVVGMMPMLYPGTRVLDERLGPALETFIRDGGGFLFLPAPGYYSGEDFVRQLNPWLKPFGASLLAELPRDPANQRTIPHLLSYRYLHTSNLARHPVTEGLSGLWLPLDHSDEFLVTHTMKVDDNWQVLVRGEASCSTHPFPRHDGVPGAYTSAPPFLAVRDWGQGRIALFTTSSQYFFFDAYHPAFGNGFVMKDGNGLALLARQLQDLAVHARPDTVGADTAAPAEARLNTGLFPVRRDWLDHVLTRLQPAGYRVTAYVDCGSLSDLPFTEERRRGFLPGPSWPVRWPWADAFHATAANARAFKKTPMTYRFSGLAPGDPLKLGVMAWCYEDAGKLPFTVCAGTQELAVIHTPRFSGEEGPVFSQFDLPDDALHDGVLDVQFRAIESEAPGFCSLGELWLWTPGTPAADSAELETQFTLPRENAPDAPATRKPFKGLIGVQAPARDVAEWCTAAQAEGLDYLVFLTDPLSTAEEDWDALQVACKSASSPDFRALAGIDFPAPVQGYVFQPLQRLPEPALFTDSYNLFWTFFSGALTGGKAAAPSLSRPGASPRTPWFQRFWRGFDVVTTEPDGRLADDARGDFAALVTGGYGPQPRARTTARTVAELRRAAAEGWWTGIAAPDLEQLESFQHTSWAGNGPVLKRYEISSDHVLHAGAGDGLLFNGSAWIVVHLAVESPTPLERVTLFSGTEPLRVWYPGRRSFAIDEPVFIARNHELWLKVEAAEGLEAIGGRILLQDSTFMTAMCADNQNSIANLARTPDRFVRNERSLYLAHSYWHTGEAAGQLGPMRDASDLVPRVTETGIIQPVKHFLPCPRFTYADGRVEDHVLSAMRIEGASRDYNRISYTHTQAEERAQSAVALTAFRPRYGGDTVVLVEGSYNQAAEHEARRIELLRIGMQPGLAADRRFSFGGPDTAWTHGSFDYESDALQATGRLSTLQGVVLWPCEAGSLLVLPLAGPELQVEIRQWNNKSRVREEITLLAPPENDSLAWSTLVVLHQGELAGEEDVRNLLQTYRALAPAYTNSTTARNHAVELEPADPGRTSPFPLRLRGMNPRWSILRTNDGSSRLEEAGGESLITTLEPGRTRISQPLRTDDPGLRLEYAGTLAGRTLFHAHNPGRTKVDTVVRVQPDAQAPVQTVPCRLEAGESGWFSAGE